MHLQLFLFSELILLQLEPCFVTDTDVPDCFSFVFFVRVFSAMDRLISLLVLCGSMLLLLGDVNVPVRKCWRRS